MNTIQLDELELLESWSKSSMVGGTPLPTVVERAT
jgi:hypothetical protein